MTACRPPLDESQRNSPETSLVESPAALRASPKRLADDLPGLHNVIETGEGIFSGGEPAGDEGFASLARLGIKTIVSVDGARPDIAAARQRGIRYVHVPIGYDGIPERAGLALARLARDADRPIYVHCHHGRHRGPAAAAITCIAAGQIEGKAALEILRAAGTGEEYSGLWRDVEGYTRPPSAIELPELVEVAQVASLAAAMAGVDRQYDDLKLCRSALDPNTKWQAPPGHADLDPLQTALLLREAFHEARRTLTGKPYDDRFELWLEEAEALAARIEAELRQAHRSEADEQLRLLEQSCLRCHAAYRN